MFPATRLGASGEEAERGLRGWRQAYPAGPDWQMRKCKGGEEPGPPEVPASPCRSAGSLPLAGRRLGGEKARRREQERGAEGLEGGVEGGGQQAGEGGLKQRAANQPGGIPSSGNQGHWGRVWRPPCLLPLPNGPLSHLASRCWGPLPNATVFCKLHKGKAGTPGRGSARQWALLHSWHERMPREWWKLACYRAQGMPTCLQLCCSDEPSALYWGGGPLTCASFLGKRGGLRWELEGQSNTAVSEVVGGKESGTRKGPAGPGVNQGTGQGPGPDRENRGYWRAGRDPDEAEGRLGSRYHGDGPRAPPPPPTQAPARPCFGRRRPCFVSMATGGAGPAPNITRCGKHAARGTPPRPLLRAEPRGALAQPRPRAGLRETPEPAREHKTRFAGTRCALGGPGLPAARAPGLREEGPAENPSPLQIGRAHV